MQREGEAERRAAERRRGRRGTACSTPRRSAAARTRQSRPQIERSVNFCDEHARREAAGIVLHRADQDLARRGRRRRARSAPITVPMDVTTKTSPRHQPRAASPRQRMKQEGGEQRRRRRGPCRPASGRARRTAPRASPAFQPLQADAEALAERQGEAQHAGGDEQLAPRARRVAAGAATATGREAQRHEQTAAATTRRRARAPAPVPACPNGQARPVDAAREVEPVPRQQQRSPRARAGPTGRRVGPALPVRVLIDGPPTRRRRAGAPYFGRFFTSCVPLGEQAAALGRRAVLGEVVVDQLDVGELGRLRRDRRRLVGRHLVGLRRGAERLRLGRQRPVVPLLGVVEVAARP